LAGFPEAAQLAAPPIIAQMLRLLLALVVVTLCSLT
jgi:hypothetical protein